MLKLKIEKKTELEDKIQKYFKTETVEGDGEGEGEETEVNVSDEYYERKVVYNSLKTQSDLVDMLASSEIDTPVKIVYLMDLLDSSFPPLEGDQVTFIGSTFVNYGEELPQLQHCICVNKSETIVPSHTLECYSTEKEAILAWSELIRKEDPDIIIGYNIFGFDYKFMFERASELDCVEKFMDLGRNLEYCIEPEESKIVLASGPYDLTRLHMSGRLQIDMYTYMRKEFNLSSYKLDFVAGYLLSDNVKGFENCVDTCKIITKNTKGLEPGSFVHFEIINNSCDLYEDGKKFKVIEVLKDGFIIDSNIDVSEKIKWGMAKDDVSPQQIFEMTKKGPAEKGIIAKYCIQDCNLVHHIFQQVDVLTTFIEMSKLCSVPIDFLVMRGQGIKGTSYVAKKCRENDVLMPLISKGNMGDA
jgi:DNA polymerase elongation subunit (family B)